MFAGRLFYNLGAATEQDVPVERSPLYKGTTSLSGAFVNWDRVRPMIVLLQVFDYDATANKNVTSSPKRLAIYLTKCCR